MKTDTAAPHTTLIPASQERPGDDPIFALNAEAQARAAKGEDVLNATLGALFDDEGQLAVIDTVHQSLHAIPKHVAAAYAPIRGAQGFLDGVMDDLSAGSRLEGLGVAAATPGGTGALYEAIANFLEPGQALLTSSYYWSPYKILADHGRRTVETYRMFDEQGGFDVDDLERVAGGLMERQGRLLLILNSPCHNPTGFSLDADEYARLGDALERLAERGPVTLVLDLAYETFKSPTSAAWQPFAERLLGTVQVVCAWTASKAFTQYGGRIGAIVAFHPDTKERQRLENAIGYTCRGTWSNCNHLGMQAVARILSDPALKAKADAERDAIFKLLDQRVATFNEHARRHGLVYPRYEGGFFVSVFTDDPFGAVDRCKQDGVFLVPLQGAVR
ncbi:MAG: aminotransferase class I/II-fold pyridoxal phosphate-dependent enzyme, partial [Planctomycetota bacterium]